MRWFRANLFQIGFSVVTLLFFRPEIQQALSFIGYAFGIYRLSDNLMALSFVILAIPFVGFVVVVAWSVASLLPNIALSLGFKASSRGGLDMLNSAGTIRVRREGADDGEVSAGPLSEEYDSKNYLSPLESAKLRLLEHIGKLRNNAVTNLFTGIAIAAIGIAILSSAITQIHEFSDEQKHIFDSTGFISSALLPKLSVTIFVQVFSFFFLAMYRSNQNDIRFFQNELTLIDSLASASIMAQSMSKAPNLKLVISALVKNERNRVIKKGEKTIVTSDEADFMRAISLINQYKTHHSEA